MATQMDSNQAQTNDQWLTPNEIAQRVRLHSSTILNFIRKGELPASHFGRSWRVKQSDFDVWMEQNQKPKQK